MAKILIVDDSLFQRRSIRKILDRRTHEIQEATNGKEGLEKLQTFQPECIILDILMPDMDGLGFLKTVRQQGKTTPIIVLTADIQETTRRECLQFGATEIVYKPLSPLEADIFLDLLARILRDAGGQTT